MIDPGMVLHHELREWTPERERHNQKCNGCLAVLQRAREAAWVLYAIGAPMAKQRAAERVIADAKARYDAEIDRYIKCWF